MRLVCRLTAELWESRRIRREDAESEEGEGGATKETGGEAATKDDERGWGPTESSSAKAKAS